MKIVIDIRTNHRSGIYRYAISLLKTFSFWSHLNFDKVYFFYINDGFKVDLNYFLSKNKISTPQISFHKFHENAKFLRNSLEVVRFLDMQKIDLYYSFHYLPDRRINVPFVFTIYDLVRVKYASFASYTDNLFLKTFGKKEFKAMKNDLKQIEHFIPSRFKPSNDRIIFSNFFYATNLCLAAKSRSIITISESTKNDIKLWLNKPNRQVDVILGAINKNIFNTKEKEKVKVKDSIVDQIKETRYCLFVGLLHERKRFPFLLQALAKIKHVISRSSKLILVGHHLDERPEMLEVISDYKVNNFIEILGEVSDSTLVELYSHACAIIIPSIEEGFCLPALEALVCGCEVIATDLPSIREVTGSHAHYFPVDDLETLAQLLQAAFNRELAKKADTFRNHFSWENSGKILANKLLASTISA